MQQQSPRFFMQHSDARIDSKLLMLDQEFKNIVESFPQNGISKQQYKDARPDEKAQFEKMIAAVCPAYLKTPEFRSGDTTNDVYKLCCDTVDYCSFYKQPWFMLVAVAGGLILLNIISVGLLTFFFVCKKKGPPGGGSSVPKTPKIEKTGKSKKSGK